MFLGTFAIADFHDVVVVFSFFMFPSLIRSCVLDNGAGVVDYVVDVVNIVCR